MPSLTTVGLHIKAYSKLGFGIFSLCTYLHVAPPWLGLSWSLHHVHCEEEEEEEKEIFFFFFAGYIYIAKMLY
jgi:hypothetical protein